VGWVDPGLTEISIGVVPALTVPVAHEGKHTRVMLVRRKGEPWPSC